MWDWLRHPFRASERDVRIAGSLTWIEAEMSCERLASHGIVAMRKPINGLDPYSYGVDFGMPAYDLHVLEGDADRASAMLAQATEARPPRRARRRG